VQYLPFSDQTLNKMNQRSLPRTCSTAELEEAIRTIEGRWKILILFHLFGAPVLRFSELRRAITGVSQKMLIQQLRDLEKDGIVERKVYPEVPPRVEYRLTKVDGPSPGTQSAAILGCLADDRSREKIEGAY